MKNSFQNVVKRISAGFVAVVVMGYSLLFCAVPGRGVVHADDVFLDAVEDFLLAAAPVAVTLLTGGNVIAGGVLSLALGPANQAMDFLKADDFSNIKKDIDTSSLSGITGYAKVDGEDSVVTFFTLPSTTFTYSDFVVGSVEGCNCYFPILTIDTPTYSYHYCFNIIPINQVDYPQFNWSSGDYVSVSSTFRLNRYGNDIDHYVRCYDSSGTQVSRYFRVDVLARYTDMQTGSERSRVLNGNIFTVLHYKMITHSNQYRDYTTEDFETFLKTDSNPLSSGPTFYVGHPSYNGSSLPVMGNGTSTPFPPFPDNIVNIDNSYEYLENYSYPYIINNYPVVEEFLSPPRDFVVEPTEPTEATGTGAVIIIDPFTLPPEWVESDVVELNTEAFTIDYDTMIDEPLDEINYPLTPTNPLRGGANILSFGIQFLKDGGVFYIICTLLVIGLLIRFLGI